MDCQDEVINYTNSMQQSVVKGKRTKRQRAQSPTPFRMITTANSYKSDQSSDICSNNNLTASDDEDDTIFYGRNKPEFDSYDNTEEEQDLANCLILLAQGKSRELRAPILRDFSTKFKSRKYIEEGGKSGYYVYECKTCGKTFSSFQALGGHRASHKKPKNTKHEDYNNNHDNKINILISSGKTSRSNYSKYSSLILSSDDEEPPFKLESKNNNNNNNNNIICSSTSLSLQLTNRALYSGVTNHQNNKGRVHECTLCGAEFSSGQALGGHMRRHRGSNTTVASSIATLPEMSKDMIKIPQSTNTSVLSFDLDLNLPALPEDNVRVDHQKESEFV
ncbi:unnamed protein product [Amaranthus hypochondriacus]